MLKNHMEQRAIINKGFPKNDFHPVPEIQGKAKSKHTKANPINYDGKW